MTALVTTPKGSTFKNKRVKSFGWLLRHAHEVRKMNIYPHPSEPESCIMVACLKGGVIYRTTWASKKVLIDWWARHHGFPENVILTYHREYKETCLGTTHVCSQD